MIKVKLLESDAVVPTRAHDTDAGYDLYALEDTFITGSPRTVRTGIATEFPPEYYAQIRGRSGLASKGLFCFHGTVDAGYRGEWLVIMYTLNGVGYHIRKGDRIAQMVLTPLPQYTVDLVDELSDSERGTSGYGSTGQ